MQCTIGLKSPTYADILFSSFMKSLKVFNSKFSDQEPHFYLNRNIPLYTIDLPLANINEFLQTEYSFLPFKRYKIRLNGFHLRQQTLFTKINLDDEFDSLLKDALKDAALIETAMIPVCDFTHRPDNLNTNLTYFLKDCNIDFDFIHTEIQLLISVQDRQSTMCLFYEDDKMTFVDQIKINAAESELIKLARQARAKGLRVRQPADTTVRIQPAPTVTQTATGSGSDSVLP